MKVLHISNGYADSKVHSNLTRALDDFGVEQTVYCPVREKRLLGKNRFEGKNIDFVYSYCIKSWYKYVYHFKRWMLYRDMKRKVDLRQFDAVYAPTFFSDGGLALKVKKEYEIPYIVAIRNTDINFYIKKLKHTYKTGREIALNASKIVFISKGEMKEFVESKFTKPIYDKIKEKIVFQPNGIEDYWHQHIVHSQHEGHDILYVGDFSPNKNITRLSEAVMQVRLEKGYEDARLIIVGGEKFGKTRKNDENVRQLINNHLDAIIALGEIYDKDKLAEVMKTSALFAMPSIHETFGLVYIEALSQNLPVIYSKGQGIDGIFDNSVGISVDALSVEEIKNAILKILNNQEFYSNKNVDFKLFKWEEIGYNYLMALKQIIKKED